MNRDDSFSMGSQNLVKLSPVHGVGMWINIDKDRRCPYQRNRLYSRDKGVSNGDHLITGANVT